MKRPHNKKKHAHNRFVAFYSVRKSELHFGLNLVGRNGFDKEEFKKQVVKGEKRENEEEKKDVVAVKDVIRLGGGILEPESLRRREGSTNGGLRLFHGGVRQHLGIYVVSRQLSLSMTEVKPVRWDFSCDVYFVVTCRI